VGGVFEIYPSRRTLIRFDVGDTIIRFDRRNVAAVDPALPPTARMVTFTVSEETKHNLQASAGFGFRF
jgi:hypothetical protein